MAYFKDQKSPQYYPSSSFILDIPVCAEGFPAFNIFYCADNDGSCIPKLIFSALFLGTSFVKTWSLLCLYNQFWRIIFSCPDVLGQLKGEVSQTFILQIKGTV